MWRRKILCLHVPISPAGFTVSFIIATKKGFFEAITTIFYYICAFNN